MLPKRKETQIALLTKTIKASWKKSVESLIEIGRCLHQLRKLFNRQDYINHLATAFSMSEMQAHRLEQLYLKFHDKQSVAVLSSKPSVLYLMASKVETKKLETLARGGKVRVGSQHKTIEQLTINDVGLLQLRTHPKARDDDDREDDEWDAERAKNAHRRLATLIEEINDWAEDILRFHQNNIQIENKPLVTRYIKETLVCLEKLSRQLS